MAYREFRNEAYYKAPEIGNIMPQTIGMIESAMRIKAQKGAQDRQRMDEFGKVDKTGYWTKNTKDIIDDSKKLVDILAYSKMNGDNRIPPEAEYLRQSIDAKREKGKVLREAAEKTKATIAQMQNDDPYFKPDDLNKKMLELNNPDLELDDIEKIIGEISQMSGNKLSTYNIAKRAKDYVDSQGEIAKDTDVTTEAGIRTQRSSKGKFFDENGVNRITDTVIEDFLKDPQTNEYYEQKITRDISDDIEKIVAGRIEEIPNTKEGYALRNMIEMGDPQAVNYLKENPELNPIDKRTSFERKSELIKPELKRYEDIANKSMADRSKSNPYHKFGSNGAVSEKFDFADVFHPADQTGFSGPGREAIRKTGTGDTPFVNVRGANPNGKMLDLNTGEPLKTGSAGSDITINRYFMGIKDKNGMPVKLPGASLDETLQYIKTAPLDDVKKWSEAVPMVEGRMLNKASIIQVQQKLQSAKKELEPKARNGDEQAASEIMELDKALNSKSPDLYSEVVQKYIGDILTNVIYPIDKTTSGTYETQTGIDPLSNKSMNDDMKLFKRAVSDRINNIAQEEKKIAAQNEKLQETDVVKGGPAPKKKAPEMGLKKPAVKSGMVMVVLPNGQAGEIPESALDQFMKDNPGAKKQ